MVVENIIPQHLDALLMKLDEIGIDLEVDVDRVIVKRYEGYAERNSDQDKAIPGFCDGYSTAADDSAYSGTRTVDHYGDHLSGTFQTLR